MNRNIKTTNLRFNLDKEIPRKAWEDLQTMDRTKFKSNNQVIAQAIVEYFERYEQEQQDPYLETREKEDQFVARIITAVEAALQQALPLFLAGYLAGTGQRGIPLSSNPASTTAEIPEETSSVENNPAAPMTDTITETENFGNSSGNETDMDVSAEENVDWDFLGG